MRRSVDLYAQYPTSRAYRLETLYFETFRPVVLAAMQHIRYTRVMYLAEKTDPAPNGGAPVILEGIVRKKCVVATYNRMAVILAPHALFTKNDALYVAAVTIERDGQRPREEKVGLFKLDGLVGLRLDERDFVTSSVYEPEDERFVGSTLMAVEG